MAYEKRFTDQPVDDPIETQPCELNAKDCFFLSHEQADIDYYNENIASPFDEDWEEYPENDDGTTPKEKIPVGVDYYSLLDHVAKMSQSTDIPPHMQQLAEDIIGHNRFFETLRTRLGSSEAFLGFMLAFVSQTERPKGSEFHYNGKSYQFGRHYYKVEFSLERSFSPYSSDAYCKPMENGVRDIHTIGQLAKLGNVQMVKVNELQRVIAVSPKYTVIDAWFDDDEMNEKEPKKRALTRGDRLSVKTYSELADELIEYIAADIEAQNTADENGEKFAQGTLIAVDIALLFTGVGAAIRLGGKVAYRVAGEVANVVLMGNQTIKDVTTFLGYNENQGYDVLLDSMRYLDSQTGNTKAFEASYHAANMFILFGKNVKTKALTGVSSASGGASLVYLDSFTVQEPVKPSSAVIK
ncbi:hypothetical protein [Providencia sneebia]|uniref:Uncharacterized protein n=1 Tax=Providencia sneebia DSM 19967 TaxID=1141660 RepID=K8WT56_9GAMM|nr:hypothetical protein OO7_05244 [Providencia sneebia DSM 19967]